MASRQVSSSNLLSWKAKQITCCTRCTMSLLHNLPGAQDRCQLVGPCSQIGRHIDTKHTEALTCWLQLKRGGYCEAFPPHSAPAGTHNTGLTKWVKNCKVIVTWHRYQSKNSNESRKVGATATPVPSRPTCCNSSWLSGGWSAKVWGRTTVRSSGFSARKAPLMTAALVPVAPEV